MSIKGLLFQPVTEECPYIDGMTAIHENLLVMELEDEDLEKLLSMGFRHFGEVFFRPLCGYCRRCISVRIPVQRFCPSPSVRRLFNRARDLRVSLENPTPSIAAFEIYMKHKKRFKAKEYDTQERYEHYVRSFFHPFRFNRMLTIRDGDVLVAVSHLDVTAHAMSAIYCYFDETYSRFSPGKLAVYKEIELAKEMGIEWLYLGYYIPRNRHTKYKILFKPNQLMVGYDHWFDYLDETGKIMQPLPGVLL
ncbi:MAG TPA: GNAT family N-acetyltransferase [Candidatus Deferrimicrobium sp.]|nr:GNAT family N-acetyltransferase [Candidatus Deferrimicrobium sp.]